MGPKKTPGKKTSQHEKLVDELRLGMKVMFALIEPGGLDIDALAAKLGKQAAVIEDLLVGLQDSRFEIKSLDGGKGKRWRAVGETVGLIRRMKGAFRDPTEPPHVDPETARKIVFTGRLLARKKEGKPLNLIERNLVAGYEMSMPPAMREEMIQAARQILGPKWNDPVPALRQKDIAQELMRTSRTIAPAAKKEAEEILEEMRREQQHQGPVHVKAKGRKEIEIGEWLQSLSTGPAKKRAAKSKEKK